MSYYDWREPVRLLEERCGPATVDQRHLAESVGLKLDEGVPRTVASVLLEDFLRPQIWGEWPASATHRQRAFLAELDAKEISMKPELTRAAASAWISHYLAQRTQQNLRTLQLARGDEVLKLWAGRDPDTGITTEYLDSNVVSSIGANGMVYFMGGNGNCGWPSSIRRAVPGTVADPLD